MDIDNFSNEWSGIKFQISAYQKAGDMLNRSPLNVKEFYFDDDLELRVIVKNKSPSKYPLKVLHFNDLEIPQKKSIIQILKTEVRS